MKVPICNVCLNSDILCMACKRKKDEGKVTESDIKISKVINEIAKTFRPLNEVEIKKVVEGKNISVLICRKGDGARLVGKDGVMIKKLSKLTGKTLRVVEESGDVKEFIQNLVNPVPVIGLNVIYKPGKEVLKIIIPRGRNIPMSKESFSEVVNHVFGKDSVVTSE
jgi:transcription antitermination factor NusA-like protein